MVYATTDSLLFQIQMSEHNYYYVEENYMTIFPSFILCQINCVDASNWFTHLQQTWQVDGQNDNSVPIVHDMMQ